MHSVAEPAELPASNSGAKKIAAYAVLLIALLGVIVPLVMAFARPRVDLSQLTPDPGLRGPGFGPMRGQQMSPEQVAAWREARRKQQEAMRMADGVTRRGNRVVVQQNGITADVIRARGGAVTVRFGYNGLQHPEEKVWLLARQRLINNTLTLNPALTKEQTEKMDALGADSAVAIENAAVKDKLLALGTPLLNAPAGATPTAPPANLPEVTPEVQQQLLAALGELTDAERDQLRADFVRRANAFRDLLTPEQQEQVKASEGR
jgi:Spy/CpxP family protein refolding chaperone